MRCWQSGSNWREKWGRAQEQRTALEMDNRLKALVQRDSSGAVRFIESGHGRIHQIRGKGEQAGEQGCLATLEYLPPGKDKSSFGTVRSRWSSARYIRSVSPEAMAFCRAASRSPREVSRSCQVKPGLN